MAFETNPTKKNRRRALKAAAAGGTVAVAVPTSWVKPTVSSVVLPGHAAMSPDGGGEPGGGTTTAAPVCDPSILSALMSSELGLRQEGDIPPYVNFYMEPVMGLPSLPSSVVITGSGGFQATTSFVEGNFTGEPAEGIGGQFEFYDLTGTVPSNGTVEFSFPGQPAPCAVTVPIGGDID